jgi:hypothetical protein
MSPIIMTPPPIPPDGDPDSPVPPTLTVTFYEQLNAHFSAIIAEVAEQLPAPKAEHVRHPALLRAHLSIPLVFLGSAVAAVEHIPELQAIGKLDPLEERDTLQLIDALRPLRTNVAVLYRVLANLINSRQAALAVKALDTYDMVKSLARDPNNVQVAVSLATLKRDLGRSGSRRKKTDAPVPATPVQKEDDDEQG